VYQSVARDGYRGEWDGEDGREAPEAAPPARLRLAEIQHDQEAICYALLMRKVRGTTKKDQPYLNCQFRDRHTVRDAMVWSDSRFFQQAQGWGEGLAYRLHARGQLHPRFGIQLVLLDVRLAGPEDAADGYVFFDLVEPAQRAPEQSWQGIRNLIDQCIDDPHVRALVQGMLDEHGELFGRMQAATNMHHAYTGGLLEHVWSMARIAAFLANHYSQYYNDLNPPLNRSVVIAAAILHDIGKLRELEYHPVEARYTKLGRLVGHILMGRDMVREAARRIPGFPEETLLLLEHAILAHHGRREYGAPVEPQTMEALIVSFVDELDAKVNSVACEFKRAAGQGESEFTEKIFALANRRFYRGVPIPLETDDDCDGAALT
jgi:3'-5' exoribonuclease